MILVTPNSPSCPTSLPDRETYPNVLPLGTLKTGTPRVSRLTAVLDLHSLPVTPKSPGIRFIVIETVAPKVLALLDVLNQSIVLLVPVLRVTQKRKQAKFGANRIAQQIAQF
ncbi:MAG: hypothetical protein ACRC46_13400 [Thermoguttaceae bacterium]